MTPDDVNIAARRLVARTTAAQGLPASVIDPRTLRSVAAVVKAAPIGGGRRAKAA